MNLWRMFSNEKYKGERGYLRRQRWYELARTALYFAVSLSLLIAGYVTTQTRANLLTIVAVLGCLPACKSAVTTFLYFKNRGCEKEVEERIGQESPVAGLYDMVFTSYDHTYRISHISVRGNTVCGFTQDPKFSDADFQKHIQQILRNDQLSDVNVKIFTNLDKYLERRRAMAELKEEEALTGRICAAFKSVVI